MPSEAEGNWKYLLCLELTDLGFDHTVLSEFRTRLIAQQAESLVFDRLLIWCQQQGWLQARGRQRTDSTHVLATIRAVTRLECALETLRAALNALAVVAPAWLQAQSQPEWIERYSERIEDYHLPVSKAGREQQAQVYGEDGKRLQGCDLRGQQSKLVTPGSSGRNTSTSLGAAILCMRQHDSLANRAGDSTRHRDD
jgi:transposase